MVVISTSFSYFSTDLLNIFFFMETLFKQQQQENKYQSKKPKFKDYLAVKLLTTVD